MKCNKFKKHASVYVDGELKESEGTALLEHLKNCAECRLDLEHNNNVKRLFN